MVTAVGRDFASAAFFDAATSGILLLPRCRLCSRWEHLEAVTCGGCAGDLGWQAASGEGTVAAWARPGTGRGDADGPILVIVELAEGPWLRTQLLGSTDPPTIGAAVTVGFVTPGGGEPVPVFRLSSP